MRLTDARTEGEDKNPASKMNSEIILHCCKAHSAKSTESDFKHKQQQQNTKTQALWLAKQNVIVQGWFGVRKVLEG